MGLVIPFGHLVMIYATWCVVHHSYIIDMRGMMRQVSSRGGGNILVVVVFPVAFFSSCSLFLFLFAWAMAPLPTSSAQLS
jgi:hypothetical protein